MVNKCWPSWDAAHRRCKTLQIGVKVFQQLGSGCSSVGRAVASDSKGPQFETIQSIIYSEHLFPVNCIEKTKIKIKEPGTWPIKKYFNSFSSIGTLVKSLVGNCNIVIANYLSSIDWTIFCWQNYLYKRFLRQTISGVGREPSRSSGYLRRLMSERYWVRIQDTRRIKFHLY